ncbi:telomerase reverse transcriptase-like [Rhizophagus clarus]|uniref:Telomerase reverse transcriptase n=1 Tax=Rhizophagus clarus TaxID=94130 RepID=A0A8H3QLZ3_9GLOM|nr:telomerase reverse transcriptase-like [Rhizophagus clarus]
MSTTLDNTTLKFYYSELNFLFDFLQPHLDDNVEILKEEDEDEYRKLLTTTVLNASTVKKFPRITKDVQQPIPEKDTCLDLTINQAIVILINRVDKKSVTNVMRFGFAKPRTLNSQGFSLTGLNSTVDYMRKSRAWLKFYTRIGQEAMVYLLTNFSLFLELQNGCYVQLTGPSISKLPTPPKLSSSTRFKKGKEIPESVHKKQTASVSTYTSSNISSQSTTSSASLSSQNEEVTLTEDSCTCSQNSIPSTSLSSSQNEEVGLTEDGCSSYQSSGGSYNLSLSSLSDDNVNSSKSILSQDIKKRKSNVLAFFRKLREEEGKAYSKSDTSSSLDPQNIIDSSIPSSQNTNEDIVSDQKIGDERMTSTFTKKETGDTTSNYKKFKEQTKSAFLKIMEAMYTDHTKVDESDKNNNPETQRKRQIEDVEYPPSKAIVLNNRDVVKVLKPNSLSNLYFSRSVMLLSSPVYNKYGELWYGLPKGHILNVIKLSKEDNISNSAIYYIFPRQFSLKNVFTSNSTGSLYYAYQDRRKELENLQCEIPDRLQHLLPYVNHIIERHNKCQYKNLLNTFCPIQDVDKTNANANGLGCCNIGQCRRFEVLSLHEILQGFKVNECKWLVPPGNKKSCNNLERIKRTEVLHEFIWWIFECLVIPLLKLNFHITHNAKHKCRLFYYRREIWLKMVQQGLEPLKNSTFEEIPSEKVAEILNGKTLGYSKVVFIPKDDEGNLRPIVNMKCPMHKTSYPSKPHKDLKRPQSINSILNTVYQILNHEKEQNPSLLNGSVFSYNEVHERLKQFKQFLADKKDFNLYFAKVDVKCCFDSIDQDKLMEIIRANVLAKTQYVVNRYDAVHPKGGSVRKSHKHYVHYGEDFILFPKYADELAQKYKNAILIENVKETYKDLEDVLELLEEHIRQNIIKAEDKYYTQKVGIPQGSILSSLLCSIYYGVMEQSELQFVKDVNGVMLHLLDDFLYISTSETNVTKFITVMHRGHPEYRCIVNDKKSMVNFDLEISGEKIKKINNPGEFPWCGLLINTHTLNVKADYSRYVFSHISDTLTIKTTRNPGEFLKQKMIEFMTTKCHWIFYDTSFNTRGVTLLNIYQNFLMIAMKFHNYIKGMPRQGSQRNEKFEAEVVHNTIKSAYCVLCKTGNQSNCTFNILKEEIIWLGIYAFLQILKKKQNYHQGVITYLENNLEGFHLKNRKLLNTIVDWNSSSVFKRIKF